MSDFYVAKSFFFVDDSATICRCNFYVHICLSVGFEIKKFYRDCWVGYHGSDMLAVNTLTESYNVSIPFTQWPTTVSSFQNDFFSFSFFFFNTDLRYAKKKKNVVIF